MGLGIMEEDNKNEFVKAMADAMIVNLAAMTAPERWVTCKVYAKLYSLSPHTIRNYDGFLRKNGAVAGEGKTMRYDKFFNPRTGKREIPK
jgi:hypothetical protein